VVNKLAPSGQGIIQTSKRDFDADELLAMVRTEGLNNMLLYASRLSHLLQVARTNPEVLEALRNMHQISYTGEALNPDDLRWAIGQAIPLAVSHD
jgi:acyl-coenzyme A synthetase/AMP-(fatty) acid ligase